MDRAWAAGVRYFDAARSYGLAEQVKSRPGGSALENLARETGDGRSTREGGDSDGRGLEREGRLREKGD